MEFTVRGEKTFAATGGRPFRPNGRTLAFIHGAGMDHTIWSLQTRFFAHHGWNVLAPDLPGHGGSAGDPIDDVPAVAAWVADAIREAGATNAVVIGHSMGALVALATAAAAPKLTGGLALLGAAPRIPVHPKLLAAARANDPSSIEMVTEWGHGEPARAGVNPVPGLWMMGGARRLLERARPGVLGIDLAACDAYVSAEEAAANVTCPTLVLTGALDRMTPAQEGRKLAGLIPGAAIVEIAGVGHMMMTEEPHRTLRELRSFLDATQPKASE